MPITRKTMADKAMAMAQPSIAVQVAMPEAAPATVAVAIMAAAVVITAVAAVNRMAVVVVSDMAVAANRTAAAVVAVVAVVSHAAVAANRTAAAEPVVTNIPVIDDSARVTAKRCDTGTNRGARAAADLMKPVKTAPLSDANAGPSPVWRQVLCCGTPHRYGVIRLPCRVNIRRNRRYPVCGA